jgi:hypothetical protein
MRNLLQSRSVLGDIEIAPPELPVLDAENVGIWHEYAPWMRRSVARLTAEALAKAETARRKDFVERVRFELCVHRQLWSREFKHDGRKLDGC